MVQHSKVVIVRITQWTNADNSNMWTYVIIRYGWSIVNLCCNQLNFEVPEFVFAEVLCPRVWSYAAHIAHVRPHFHLSAHSCPSTDPPTPRPHAADRFLPAIRRRRTPSCRTGSFRAAPVPRGGPEGPSSLIIAGQLIEWLQCASYR